MKKKLTILPILFLLLTNCTNNQSNSAEEYIGYTTIETDPSNPLLETPNVFEDEQMIVSQDHSKITLTHYDIDSLYEKFDIITNDILSFHGLAQEFVDTHTEELKYFSVEYALPSQEKQFLSLSYENYRNDLLEITYKYNEDKQYVIQNSYINGISCSALQEQLDAEFKRIQLHVSDLIDVMQNFNGDIPEFIRQYKTKEADSTKLETLSTVLANTIILEEEIEYLNPINTNGQLLDIDHDGDKEYIVWGKHNIRPITESLYILDVNDKNELKLRYSSLQAFHGDVVGLTVPRYGAYHDAITINNHDFAIVYRSEPSEDSLHLFINFYYFDLKTNQLASIRYIFEENQYEFNEISLDGNALN